MQNNEWMDEDPYSSGDEISTAQRTRSRDRRSTRNISLVQAVVAGPSSPSDPQNRAFVSALSTIREDPAVKSQLERIEQIWTVNNDRVLADVMYTEVMLAIVQAAKAVATAGIRGERRGERDEEETEEEYTARMSARRRTIGNFAWREDSAGVSRGAQRSSAMNERDVMMSNERMEDDAESDESWMKVRART